MELIRRLPQEANDKIHLGMIKDYYGCIESHGNLLFHGSIQVNFLCTCICKYFYLFLILSLDKIP